VLRFFNSNSIGVLVLLVLIPFIYWIPDFVRVAAMQDQTFAGTIPAMWISSFNASHRVLSMFIALLLILTNAYLLIQLNTIHIFIPVRTQLPALFYILLAACFNPTRMLTPALLASLLIILILYRLFITYKYEGPSVNFLDSGLLISLASLIYFPSILFFPFLLVALVMLRPLNWREWAYVFVGLLLPYLFLVTGYYLMGAPVSGYFQDMSGLFVRHKINFSAMQWAGLLFILGMLVYASYFMASAIDNMKIQGRKIFMLLLWLFLFSGIIYGTIPGAGLDIFSIAAIPLAYLFSHYFCSSSRNWINEGLFGLFLLIVVLLRIF
jgi:hypothetical protein